MRIGTILIMLAIWAYPAIAQQAEREAELAAKIQRQLEQILGPGKAVVTVSGSLVSEQRQTRQSDQLNTLPLTVKKQTDGAHTNTQTQFIHSSSETLTSQAPGSALERVSVSVQVELPLVKGAGEDGNESDAAVKITRAQIVEMVMASAHLDESQGDSVDLQIVTLDTSAADQLKAEMEKSRPQNIWLVFSGIAVMAVLLGLGLALLLLRHRQRTPVPEPMAWVPPVNETPPPPDIQS